MITIQLITRVGVMKYHVIVVLSLLLIVSAYSQAQVHTRINPENPEVHTLSYWGIMRGLNPSCPNPNKSEEFGGAVIPLGDINHDGLQDWAVSHNLCDTNDDGRIPNEWLVYEGRRDGVPAVESGKRIGPSEIFSESSVLCAGDWDNDGNMDIVVRMLVYNDTSFGNQNHDYDVSVLAVFWGHIDGHFTLADTMRLSCGADGWFGPTSALDVDMDSNGIKDLIVYGWEGAGFSAGHIVSVPKLFIYYGHKGDRWGRNGVSRSPDWGWWTPPVFNDLAVTDQDCDGNQDLVLLHSIGYIPAEAKVSVLYGRPGQLPDTTSVQTVYLANIQGQFPLFTDLTGDGVPELAVSCSDELIRIYAGRAGSRLLDQVGDGDEPPDANHGYARPWAVIDEPRKLHDGWFPAQGGLIDLGDVGGDGINDICTYVPPFLVWYNGGKRLDSLIDAEVRWGVLTSAVRLGDIDGSGVSSFALGFSGSAGGVAFYKPTDSVPNTGFIRFLPHPEGFRCEHVAGVAGKHSEMSERKRRMMLH